MVNRKHWLWLSLALTVAMVAPAASPAATVKAAETKDLVVLGTSDIHGNVDNYDYFTDSVPTGSSLRGLTKVATYVKDTVASNPNTIVIDDGDTIQGTPLSYWAELLHPELPNPMALAMNRIGFVASTVGNHEFNYGPSVFNKYQSEATFPLLSANVTGCRDYTFTPYVIKDVDGVQVGILGLTPPAVKYWERPENIVDCVFGDAMTAANHYVPEMKAAGADVIIVAAHTGLDETYGYGREENFAKYLANEVPGIDVILAGHAHANVAGQLVNGVLITEPNYHTRNLSDIRITVSGGGTDWSVTTKASTTPVMGTSVVEDTTLKGLMQPYHDGTVTYINTPIGTATAAFPGGYQARVADGPMADLINQVQTEAAAAAGFPVQASLAALFTNDAKLSAGPIKLKDAYAVYIYDNTLYVIEATGQMIRDELEWTANYFNQYSYEPAGVTVNGAVRDYNYDLWSGIQYKLDVTRPVGQRVVELTLDGKPLAMDQVVRVALNNYRATGKFPAAKILYQSTTEVRELVTNWIMAHSPISPSDVYVHNFDLLPAPALWQNPAESVTRTDNVNLLWTAFGQTPAKYVVPVGDNKKAPTINRENEFYLIGSVGLAGRHDVTTDWKLIKQYADWDLGSGWAKDSTAFVIQTGIFTPADNMIRPKQTVTNAEALAWVREARYPLYTFLSTNDLHGQLEPKALSSSNPDLVGGAAYDLTYINRYRALNPLGTSLYDAGDIMQGMPISNLLWGESVIDAYNHMGYQAATVGNHEFDWGQATLKERIAQAEFPFVVANIFNEGTNTRPSWAKPSVMFTVKGQQIGVIGVTSKDTPGIVMAGNCAGLEFRPVGPIVAQETAALRTAGADLVVVLAHMPDVYNGVRQEMLDVAQPGVDLIIAGHSHNKHIGKVNGIPIIEQYSSGTAIGVSDLRYDRLTRSIFSSDFAVVTTYNKDKDGNDVGADPTIAALVAEYQAEIAPTVNKVVATTLGLISRGPDRYTGEVPMGDLIADAQAWKGGTQIAFMNPGGIRADIAYATYPHAVTWGDFFTVQPFDNKLVTMKLTGSQIYDLLEQQFKPPQSSMKLLQASGIKYHYDLSLPVGSRITSLTLSDGTPILDDGTTYTVTCNEFIATGGDGFSAFLGGTDVTRIGVSDLDALIDFVAWKFGTPPDNTPIDPSDYPTIEGRFVNDTP